VKGKGIRLLDRFTHFVPRCFEVVYAKFLKGLNGGAELFIAVSFSCQLYQKICIGPDTPLNTFAHCGVIPQSPSYHEPEDHISGQACVQGEIRGTEQVSLGAPPPRTSPSTQGQDCQNT